jgi:hypothetical protein
VFFILSKSGTTLYKKLGDNFNIYSYRGATEEISEQNRTIIRRLVQIEERIEELEKMVGELLEASKNDSGKGGVI